MSYFRVLRKTLGGEPAGPFRRYSAATHIAMTVKAYQNVTAFYTVNLLLAYQTLYLLMEGYFQPGKAKLFIEPLWPVFFASAFDPVKVAEALALFYMGASMFAALWPQSRFWRIAVFIAFFQTTAFKYSFGVINEKEQWWLWTSFLFIFLPSSKLSKLTVSIRSRQHYLDVFSLAQGMLLLFYSLIGFWKFYHGFGALVNGSFGIFSTQALPYICAARVLVNHGPVMWAPFTLAHPFLCEAAFILVSYIEFFAFLVWFRPSLQPLWGMLLMLLHIGTWLFMTITFPLQPPLLAIMLLHSPFLSEGESWRRTLFAMPLFASLRRVFSSASLLR